MVIPKAEVECDKLSDGDVITGNFCRGGDSAGGLSSWSPVNGDFHGIEQFGRIIAGSTEAFFLKNLNALAAESKKIRSDAKQLADFAGALDDFRNECKRFGNDPAYFDHLNVTLGNLRNLLVSCSLSGRSCLLWENDTWENLVEPSLMSKPVTSIKLRAAQNSKILYGMTFSNLCSRPFLGLAKCFERWPLQSGNKSFYGEPWNDFLDRIELLEGVPLQNSGGNTVYDPMIPLPLKNILRAPPNGNLPLWLSITTKGLKPGKYTAALVIKPSYPGFELIHIPLELEVLPIDLGEVHLDSYHYAFFTEWPINTPHFRNI